MAALYINARSVQMLRILLNRNEYLSMEQLAQELKVSRRTVYYDISRVNLWLKQSGVPPLEVERKLGIHIRSEQRERIEQLLSERGGEEVYIYSPEERVKLMILFLIYSPEPVFIEQLMDFCEVSRNTVFGDLKVVSEQLRRYDISLDYHNKEGYMLSGSPIRIRALFMLYFRETMTLYRDGILNIFDRDQIENYHRVLQEIETELGLEYVDGAIQAVSALLPVMLRHDTALDLSAVNREKLSLTQEFQSVRKHFPQLAEDEQVYLALHLLGSQVNIASDEWMGSASQQEISDMARALVSEFERIACINFDNRRALEQALALHLKTSLYRYQYGIQIGNLFYDDIINEYPELFGITKAVAKRLEDTVELPIPDEEVACLALHFGAFLKIGDRKTDTLRVLIVCVNGVSTGNMLKREVMKLLPDAEIVDVVAAVDMLNVQNICNLIISTIRINSVVPVITVHPVLTEFDRYAILSHRLVAPKLLGVQRDRIFQVVKKYVDPANYDRLLGELTACLQGGQVTEADEFRADSGLLSILDISRVAVYPKEDSWRNSIRLAGKPLLKNGSIQREYLDTIISQIEYYGPYMFLTDNVILAHAKPENGVNRLDLSIAAFQTPVIFTEQRKAKLVIVLAAEDQEKHLKILQDILILVSDAEFINTLADYQTSSDLLYAVRKLLEQK